MTKVTKITVRNGKALAALDVRHKEPKKSSGEKDYLMKQRKCTDSPGLAD